MVNINLHISTFIVNINGLNISIKRLKLSLNKEATQLFAVYKEPNLNIKAQRDEK